MAPRLPYLTSSLSQPANHASSHGRRARAVRSLFIGKERAPSESVLAVRAVPLFTENPRRTLLKRSPEQPESYVLRGGQAGAARLRLINRVKWPTTERLLGTAGLRAGMRVLDLGCGGGAVTLKIAALVGAEGEVVGIDLDSSILWLAHQEADGSKLPMTFHHLDAEELDEVAVYEFVYSATCCRTCGSRSGPWRPWCGRCNRRLTCCRGRLLPWACLLSTQRRLRPVFGALPGGGASQRRRPADRSALDGHGVGRRAERRAGQANRAHLPRGRGKAGCAGDVGAYSGGGVGCGVGNKHRTRRCPH